MASSTLLKLLRNQSESASKIFTHFRQPVPPLPPSLLTQIPQITKHIDAMTYPGQPKTDCLKPNHPISAHVYPSFSFGFVLNPVSPTLLIRSERVVKTTAEDAHIIRADSVKKKRKKKMNKHKLRKLRKRLRKKT